MVYSDKALWHAFRQHSASDGVKCAQHKRHEKHFGMLAATCASLLGASARQSANRASTSAMSRHVRVRVPYAGEHLIEVSPTTTASELCTQILQQNNYPDQEEPHCLVHRGSILRDDLPLPPTVADSDVLHLLKSSSAHRASDAAQQEPDQHDHEHHHHHHHDHNHANIFFGHFNIEGRIEFDGVRQVLQPVLQALGFSHRATNAAAEVGAAIAISNEATAEGRNESRGIVARVAHDDTQRAQRVFQGESERPGDSTEQSATRSEEERNNPSPLTTMQTIAPVLGGMLQTLGTRLVNLEAESLNVEESHERNTALLAEMSTISAALTSATALVSTFVPVPTTPENENENDSNRQNEPTRTRNNTGDRSPPPRHAGLFPMTPPIRIGGSGTGSRGRDEVISSVSVHREFIVPHPVRRSSSLQESGDSSTRPSSASSESSDQSDDITTQAGATRTGTERPVSSSDPPSEPGQQAESTTAERTANTSNMQNPEVLIQMFSNMFRNALMGVSETAPNGQAGSSNTLSSSLASGNTPQRNAESGSASSDDAQQDSTRGVSAEPGSLPSGIVQSSNTQSQAWSIPYNPALQGNADFIIRLLDQNLHYFEPNSRRLERERALVQEDDLSTPDSVGDQLRLAAPNRSLNVENRALQVLLALLERISPAELSRIWDGDFSCLIPLRVLISQLVKEKLGDSDTEAADMSAKFAESMLERVMLWVDPGDSVNIYRRHSTSETHFSWRQRFRVDVHAYLIDLANLVLDKSSCADEEFPSLLALWLDEMSGYVLNSLASYLDGGWQAVVSILRKNAFACGARLFGSEYAVLLPICFNLFLRRAHVSYERATSRLAPGSTIEYRFGPKGSFNRSLGGKAKTCANSSENGKGQAGNGPGSSAGQGGTPNATPSSSTVPSGASSLGNGYSGDDDGDGNERRPLRNGNEPGCGSDMPDVSRNVKSSSKKDGAATLDDSELDRLAEECMDDVEMSDLADSPDGDTSEFDSLANELMNETERASTSANIQSAPAQPVTAGRTSTTLSSLGNFMSRGRNSGFLGLRFGQGNVSNNVSGSGVSRGSVQTGPDEFDVLGVREGARWRRVLAQDAKRIPPTSIARPLSRSYLGERAPVRPLNATSAAVLSAEAARAAAAEVNITGEELNVLIARASELGEAFLPEVEQAIASRIAVDPEYSEQRFPNAAVRFQSR